MQFQNAIITEQGVRIFQAALANNPVVFTRCLFSGSPTPLTASMIALPEPTWGNGHVTNYAANDSGGDFVIYASATNETDYGYAYGYGIYGYLQNEGIENEKLLVVANYDGNVTYVSEASGPYTRFHFAITIKLSMAAGVLSIAPHYNDLVSDVAFQQLANRTVTTHSAADARVGDDQTVRGHKEFLNGVGVWDSNNGWGLEIDNYNDAQDNSIVRMRTTNGVYYANGIEFKHRDEDGSYVQNMMYVNSNIVPSEGAIDLSLGDRERTFFSAYVRVINADSVYATQTIRASIAELSTQLRTPFIELSGPLSFYNTELGDDNIRLAWYDDELALKFQPGAVRSTVEFDVPVKFDESVNATNATIYTLEVASQNVMVSSVYMQGAEERGQISGGNRGVCIQTNYLELTGFTTTTASTYIVPLDGGFSISHSVQQGGSPKNLMTFSESGLNIFDDTSVSGNLQTNGLILTKRLTPQNYPMPDRTNYASSPRGTIMLVKVNNNTGATISPGKTLDDLEIRFTDITGTYGGSITSDARDWMTLSVIAPGESSVGLVMKI